MGSNRLEPYRGPGAGPWVTGWYDWGVPSMTKTVEPWADKYGQDFFDWYASASVDERKRYQTALMSWDMPGKEATIGWCRRYDQEHGGDLGILPNRELRQALGFAVD